MKRIILIFSCFYFLFSSCTKDDQVAPGLSLDVYEMNAYIGHEISLRGIASDNDGIAFIEIASSNSVIYHQYDLRENEPAVISFNYKVKLKADWPVGDYTINIKTIDLDGNTSSKQMRLTVFEAIKENPVSDYPAMYLVYPDEDESQYYMGYYRYMKRIDKFVYEGVFWSPADRTNIAFVPEQSLKGDNYFAESPIVPGKLINNKTQSKPIVLPSKGYYTIRIDVKSGSYTRTSYTPSLPELGYASNPLVIENQYVLGDIRADGTGWNWTEERRFQKIDTYIGQCKARIDIGDRGAKLKFMFVSPPWNWGFRPVDGAPGKAQITGWHAAGGANDMFVDTAPKSGNYYFRFDYVTKWADVRKAD